VSERCILNKLNETIRPLLGPGQHGFRPGHSTTTCLLEMKDSILNVLDDDMAAVMYRLDLSEAFDMLRKDTFSIRSSLLITIGESSARPGKRQAWVGGIRIDMRPGPAG